MTKYEIIQELADSTIPEGTTLMERTLPFGITVSRVTSGQTARGLNIMMARMFASSLKTETATLSDEADANLFEAMHRTIVLFHEGAIAALTIPALEVEVIENHRKIVGRLRQIAKELGILYNEPKDPLLE